jgi:hypothetical protein
MREQGMTWTDAWGRVRVPLAIGAVFATPLILALLVHWRSDWQPVGRLEHGELMRPVRVLEPPRLSDPDGRRLDDTLFRGRWTLLYSSPASCGADCLRLMDTLVRVCRAQPRGPGRVQRVLVVRVLPEETARVLRQIDPGLRMALSAEPWGLPQGQVYLVDPLGNLVLRYPPGFAPQGLARDLGRLLGLSRIG